MAVLGSASGLEPPVRTYDRLRQVAAGWEEAEWWTAMLGVGPADGEQWLAADELFDTAGGLLERTVASHREAIAADSANVAAALLLKVLPVDLAWVALSCWVAERRIPDLELANIALAVQENGRVGGGLRLRVPRFAVLADDPAAPHPDAVAVPDEVALLEWLDERLLSGAFERALAAVRARYRVSSHVVRGNLAAACGGALHYLGEHLDPQRARSCSRALWARRPDLERLVEVVPVEIGYGWTKLKPMRRTCCLVYRCGGQRPRRYCGTCPLIPIHVRQARYSAYFRGEPWQPITDADRT